MASTCPEASDAAEYALKFVFLILALELKLMLKNNIENSVM